MSAVLGDGVVTIWRAGSTNAILANVLGIEKVDGYQKVYLDRLVHNDAQIWEEWSASGCVSTILHRQTTSVPAQSPARAQEI